MSQPPRLQHPSESAGEAAHSKYGLGAILVSSILFGAMAVCVRLAAREMAADQIAFIRFLGALLVLLAARGGQTLRPQPGNLPRVLLRGFLGGCAILLYFRGIHGAGAAFATLLHCTYPVYTAMIATALMGERFNGRIAVALALNVAGAVILLGPGANLDRATFAGGMSAVGASVLAGGAVAAARYLRATESAFLITTYFMAVGAVLTLPSLLSGIPPLTPMLLFALAGTILTSVAGQFLLHHGLGFTGAIQGSITCASTVVSTAAFEALFLGETLAPHALAGAALFIAAVALVAMRGRT
jgi:drug/metabolite transporter (DMT)-like permease